jgi:glycosyltransferase involved in cell wall biosynthesis
MDRLRKYEAVRIGSEIDTALARLVTLGTISEQVKAAVQGLVGGTLQLPSAANDTAPAQQNPFARVGSGEAVDESTLDPVPDGKLDIVIFTGPAFEQWTPETIEQTGIGGSETMAWEMARGLARLGHRVRHYGWCSPEQEKRYEGVYWLDSARYRDIKCDALIVSRYADGVQCVGGTKARARLLWVHDCYAGNMTPEHAGRYDRVLCLSEWHKQNVLLAHPFIDPERIVVTRNGIDLGMFDGVENLGDDALALTPRNPLRAVYSSSPDRGLQTALELWPLIRAEVPEAELHVFYGFDGLRKVQPALADALEAQAKVTPGVVLHGRVPPRELAREFMRSGVWFYPTWFSETSCITAMQAQAAGLYVVTSPIAALNEAVLYADGNALLSGAPGPIDMQTRGFELHPPSAEYRSNAVSAVVARMRLGSEWRDGVMAAARERFGLPALCSDWSAMLSALVVEVDTERVSKFYVHPEFAKAARETDEAA